MRILIDLQGAQNGSRDRGIGRYSLAIAQGIARNAGDHAVFILLNGLFPDTIEDLRASFSDLLPADRFLIFTAPGPVSGLSSENNWRRCTAEIMREHVIDMLSPDAILVTSMVDGSNDDTVTSVGWIRSSVPTAAIMYDLIPLSDPERYVGWEPARLWYHNKIDSFRRADLLLAISQSAANEAIELLGAEPRRVKTILSAADDSFSSRGVSASAGAAVAKTYGIVRRYLMHSSAFEERKNFQGLIRAYAGLPTPVRSNYQLVLVCKLDASGRNQLTTLASNLGLKPNDLVLTGYVPDQVLIALYSACHLFVFPSFHEGFGLPPLEAMSCGTPTIGSNATSVPEVIGRDDALFDPASVPEMSALILKALTDTGFYQSLQAHAQTQARKFSWDETARRAILGLEEMACWSKQPRNGLERLTTKRSKLLGAIAEVARNTRPSDRELLALARSVETNLNAVDRLKASAAFGGKLSWQIEEPIGSSYSFSAVNRETARALEALGHTVVLRSTEGPGYVPASRDFLPLNSDLAEMHSCVTDCPQEAVDVSGRNLYPSCVRDVTGRLNLLHQCAWEETGLPPAWAANFNNHLDGLACVSTHVQKVLVDNGVHVPMVVSGTGVDHWERVEPTPGFSVAGRTFRFLHVSSCFPSKGIDVLLDAYGKVFSGFDDVSLIIKTFPNPHNEVASLLTQRRSANANFPHVIVIEESLGDSDLKALYQECHALVAPSRAEGFGLPLAEAMLSGLPVIATAWSGQLDFCTEDTAWPVDYSLQRARSHIDVLDSVWAEPDVEALARTLMDVFKAPIEERCRRADAGRQLLLDRYRWIDVASRLVMAARSWRSDAQRDPQPHIAWVTTWNAKCGVASYSEHLLAHFPQAVTVMAPANGEMIGEDGSNCLRAWCSGKDNNRFDELSAQIARRRINVLVLQFNFGLYSFRELSDFLNEQVDAGRAIILMMHSTSDPGLLPAWNWTLAELVPAFARCHRLLVHSIDDLNRLKQLGLATNVALFPHGVLDVPAVAPPPASVSPLVVSYGYCLPHKGLVELVRAVDLLRKQGSAIRLRLVNAEYPIPASAEIVAEIRRLISSLGLEDFVETHHDYLSDEQSLKLLQEAALIVFPYQESGESASGAVRYGLSARRPVAVTPIPIFTELGDAVHRLPGSRPEELANGIEAVLRDIQSGSDRARTVANQAESWRTAHKYQALSAQLLGICKSLAREAQSHELFFNGSSKQLTTKVGRPFGRSLRSTGNAGRLLTGPFTALAAGKYRVVVTGKYEIPVGSQATLEVRSETAGCVFAKLDLSDSLDASNVEAGLFLNKRCHDLEIRMTIDARASVQIDQIGIVRIDASADAAATTICVTPEVADRKAATETVVNGARQ
jgi:glycosyltransferase involved in cell wall biosynthesis